MGSRKVKEKLLERGTQNGAPLGICSGKAHPLCSESEKKKKKMSLESKKPKNSNSLKSKNKKVLLNDSKKSRSIEQKRTWYGKIYDDVEAKFSVMERAERVLTRLENGLPSFVKCMLPSNVAHGFWLHLPKKFCTLYFPSRDSTIYLVDEWGNEYKTSYLLERHGLSAGWRRFSISHRLLKGDILIFHLIEPCKLKVHIVRVNRSEVMSAALCLMNLDVSRRGTDNFEDLVKENNRKHRKMEYVEPFLLDISTPTENLELKNEPCSNFESNSDDFSSKIIKDGGQVPSRAVHLGPSHSGTTHSSPPEARGNLFLGGVSAAGVQLVKGLLSPTVEAYLRELGPNHKLFEGTALALSGLQVLVSAYEEFDSIAKKEGDRARTISALHQQVQGELTRARLVHEDTVNGLRSTSEIAYQQPEVAQADLEEALAANEAANARADTLALELSSLEAQVQSLTEELDRHKTRAVKAESTLENLLQSQEEWRTSFLESSEFKTTVEVKAYYYFKTGFYKCRDQFKEAGLLLADKKSFPDFGVAIASLPKDNEEAGEEDARSD